MNITIDSNSNFFNSVLWYITQFKHNCDNLKYEGIEILSKPGEPVKEKIHFMCDNNSFKFFYKDQEIEVSISNPDHCIPMIAGHSGDMKRYQEIKLSFVNENTEDDDNMKLIVEFLEEAKDKYKKLKNFKFSKGKIVVWGLDGCWWEELQEVDCRLLDSVILEPKLKTKIQSALDKFCNIELKEKLKTLGIKNKLNIVLEGLPGTGKSSTAIAIATTLQKDIASIDFNQKDLNDISFIKSMRKFPHNAICLLEDFDALFLERNKTDNTRVSFSCLLNFLDGAFSRSDMISIITTNHISKIDKAILRPMRTDYVFTFSYCSKYQCEKMFAKLFSDHDELFKSIYSVIKNKKFTSCMFQKWLINNIENPEKLIDNIKNLDELIDLTSEKEANMFT